MRTHEVRRAAQLLLGSASATSGTLRAGPTSMTGAYWAGSKPANAVSFPGDTLVEADGTQIAAFRSQHSAQEDQMKFALLMTANYARWREMTPEQSQVMETEVLDFNDRLGTAGVLIATEGMDEAARHVHFHRGHHPDVQDGPVSAAPEQLAAFWVIDVADMDAAIKWARQAPVADGAVEVRPIG